MRALKGHGNPSRPDTLSRYVQWRPAARFWGSRGGELQKVGQEGRQSPSPKYSARRAAKGGS
jgi:hypothetical protein